MSRLSTKNSFTTGLLLIAVILLMLTGCGKNNTGLPEAYFKDIPLPSDITIQSWDVGIDDSDENPLLKTSVTYRTFSDIEEVVKFYDKNFQRQKKKSLAVDTITY